MDLEAVFGMPSTILRKIFWENTDNFVSTHVHLATTLKSLFMRQRERFYAEFVKLKGTPLENA